MQSKLFKFVNTTKKMDIYRSFFIFRSVTCYVVVSFTVYFSQFYESFIFFIHPPFVILSIIVQPFCINQLIPSTICSLGNMIPCALFSLMLFNCTLYLEDRLSDSNSGFEKTYWLGQDMYVLICPLHLCVN